MDDRVAARACPHCGMRLYTHAEMHIRRCVDNPEAGERLRAFLHAHAHDGHILSAADYEPRSRVHDLPTCAALRKRFGSWGAVAQWAGLKENHRGAAYGNDLAAQSTNRALRRQLDAPLDGSPIVKVGGDDHEAERAAEYRMFEGMPAVPGVMVVGAWEIRSKRYRPVRVETGWYQLR